MFPVYNVISLINIIFVKFLIDEKSAFAAIQYIAWLGKVPTYVHTMYKHVTQFNTSFAYVL